MISSISNHSNQHLCPRIIDLQTNYISFGGNPAWLSRKTAIKGSSSSIAATNILVAYAKNNIYYATQLELSFFENGLINQTDYVILLHDIYVNLKPLEIPILNRIYDKSSVGNKLFSKITPALGMGIRKLAKGMLKYALKKDILLQPRFLFTMFCGYTRGITFIKLALAHNYPVVLLTSFNSHPLTVFDNPHLYDGQVHNMRTHYVTITGIRESKTDSSLDLVITTWGRTATISYDDLYRSWQSIRSIGSGMVYFIPAKDTKSVKRFIKKAWHLIHKR